MIKSNHFSERSQLPARMAEQQEAGGTYSDCGALDLSSNSSAKGHTTEEEDEGEGGSNGRGKRKMENWCAEEGRRKWARWIISSFSLNDHHHICHQVGG